jgi:Tfp pilus assembly protein PilZ
LDNHELGLQSQELVIEKVENLPYKYSVTKKLQFIDPITKKVAGNGIGLDNLNENGLSVYSQQKAFFPK